MSYGPEEAKASLAKMASVDWQKRPDVQAEDAQRESFREFLQEEEDRKKTIAMLGKLLPALTYLRILGVIK